jgi:hypothetical protein
VPEENIYVNIQKKAPSFSEEVTSNNITVGVSILLSENESKTAMQTTRMGPLTFNLNPQL